MFACAAAFLRIPKAFITGIGILSYCPPILKFCNDLYVAALLFRSNLIADNAIVFLGLLILPAWVLYTYIIIKIGVLYQGQILEVLGP